jgi:hypothetical protein
LLGALVDVVASSFQPAPGTATVPSASRRDREAIAKTTSSIRPSFRKNSAQAILKRFADDLALLAL